MALPNYVRTGKVNAARGYFNQSFGSVAASVTAKAGGGKASATQLTAMFNRLSTVATANDSVLLPKAEAGMSVYVFNTGAASARIFGQGTDTIDGVATATGVPLANDKRAVFICFENGKWISAQLGVVSA